MNYLNNFGNIPNYSTMNNMNCMNNNVPNLNIGNFNNFYNVPNSMNMMNTKHRVNNMNSPQINNFNNNFMQNNDFGFTKQQLSQPKAKYNSFTNFNTHNNSNLINYQKNNNSNNQLKIYNKKINFSPKDVYMQPEILNFQYNNNLNNFNLTVTPNVGSNNSTRKPSSTSMNFMSSDSESLNFNTNASNDSFQHNNILLKNPSNKKNYFSTGNLKTNVNMNANKNKNSLNYKKRSLFNENKIPEIEDESDDLIRFLTFFKGELHEYICTQKGSRYLIII